jgi:hypothetical protein
MLRCRGIGHEPRPQALKVPRRDALDLGVFEKAVIANVDLLAELAR